MFSALWPKSLRRRLLTSRRRPPAPQRGRPRLEGLEERCVPSTVTNLSDHDPPGIQAVTTQHNDNGRTGDYLSETTLTCPSRKCHSGSFYS
jgi:hypothetical protein